MRRTCGSALLLAGIAAALCTGSCSSSGNGSPPPVNGGGSGGGMDATAMSETGGGGEDVSQPMKDAASTPDVAADAPPVDAPEEIVVTEGSFPCMTSYDAGSPACEQCVHDQCCGMLETCQSNSTCSSAIACLAGCVADGGAYDGCYDSCAPTGPQSIAYVEFAECVQNQCSSACSFPADGGTGTTDAAGDGGPHV